MKKHGFNENELVKTIVEMIDKDGFHKQVVTYGSRAPEIPKMQGCKIGVENGVGVYSESLKVSVIVINVPDSSKVYFGASPMEEDFLCEVGAALESQLLSSSELYDKDHKVAAWSHHTSDEYDTEMYIQAYAVDDSNKVIERTSFVATLEAPK